MAITQDRLWKLQEFQSKFRDVYQFNDIMLLNAALTHTSYPSDDNYKRLEWLGDSILKFVTTVHLHITKPNCQPGDVNNERVRMENNATLTRIANELKVNQYLLTGKGFDVNSFRSSCDIVEALIGAIYMDAKSNRRDWEQPIRRFMSKYWTDEYGKRIQFRDI